MLRRLEVPCHTFSCVMMLVNYNHAPVGASAKDISVSDELPLNQSQHFFFDFLDDIFFVWRDFENMLDDGHHECI